MAMPTKDLEGTRRFSEDVLGTLGIDRLVVPGIGAGWPWRPTALFALCATAAVGISLVPAAVTRWNRR